MPDTDELRFFVENWLERSAEERRDILREQECKFFVTVEGRSKAAYMYDPDGLRQVVKVDGEHTYLYYRDPRLDWTRARPIWPNTLDLSRVRPVGKKISVGEGEGVLPFLKMAEQAAGSVLTGHIRPRTHDRLVEQDPEAVRKFLEPDRDN